MPNTIAQNLTRLANAKEAIAEAIEGKGGTLEEGDGFEDFANAIENISGGSSILVTKNITSNGVYSAIDDNADGYSAVTVAVPSADYVSDGLILSYIDATAGINSSNTYKMNWYFVSSRGFSCDIYLKLTDSIDNSSTGEACIFDTRPSTDDRYSLRFMRKSSNGYSLYSNRNSTWIDSFVSNESLIIHKNEPHTITFTASGDGAIKVYCDGTLWTSQTVTGGTIHWYRDLFIFTNYAEESQYTLKKDYRVVERLMFYNRTLTEAEIRANRASDIKNFET